MTATILCVQNNATASFLSTPLTGNATVGAADNQRVWVANSATSYQLTLPATNSAQDFYVRAVVANTGGVTVQAPAGVQIYMGNTVGAVAGSIASSSIGSTVVLYNPAGTSVWMAVALTGQWSVT